MKAEIEKLVKAVADNLSDYSSINVDEDLLKALPYICEQQHRTWKRVDKTLNDGSETKDTLAKSGSIESEASSIAYCLYMMDLGNGKETVTFFYPEIAKRLGWTK